MRSKVIATIFVISLAIGWCFTVFANPPFRGEPVSVLEIVSAVSLTLVFFIALPLLLARILKWLWAK